MRKIIDSTVGVDLISKQHYKIWAVIACSMFNVFCIVWSDTINMPFIVLYLWLMRTEDASKSFKKHFIYQLTTHWITFYMTNCNGKIIGNWAEHISNDPLFRHFDFFMQNASNPFNRLYAFGTHWTLEFAQSINIVHQLFKRWIYALYVKDYP